MKKLEKDVLVEKLTELLNDSKRNLSKEQIIKFASLIEKVKNIKTEPNLFRILLEFFTKE